METVPERGSSPIKSAVGHQELIPDHQIMGDAGVNLDLARRQLIRTAEFTSSGSVGSVEGPQERGGRVPPEAPRWFLSGSMEAPFFCIFLY